MIGTTHGTKDKTEYSATFFLKTYILIFWCSALHLIITNCVSAVELFKTITPGTLLILALNPLAS